MSRADTGGAEAAQVRVPPTPAATTVEALEPPAYVYAIGQLEARFPTLSVEKEFAQATAALAVAGQTDRELMRLALGDRHNRYLARSLCWVLTIQGLETYIVVPRDTADLDLLIDAYRPEPGPADLDVVIGTRSGFAPPTMCNGLMLPVVEFEQLYSFDRATLVESIPKPDSVASDGEAAFRASAGRLLDQVMQIADNAGAIAEHRALNYLAVRYPPIYAVTTEQHGRNFAFTGVEVIPSLLSGVREIVDVVFSYRHRETDLVEQQFIRVDVTEQFPFLVTKMSPYVERRGVA